MAGTWLVGWLVCVAQCTIHNVQCFIEKAPFLLWIPSMWKWLVVWLVIWCCTMHTAECWWQEKKIFSPNMYFKERKDWCQESKQQVCRKNFPSLNSFNVKGTCEQKLVGWLVLHNAQYTMLVTGEKRLVPGKAAAKRTLASHTLLLWIHSMCKCESETGKIAKINGCERAGNASNISHYCGSKNF